VRPAKGDSVAGATAAREHLEGLAGRSLLVFDNATDPDAVARWLPRRGGCQVVVV